MNKMNNQKAKELKKDFPLLRKEITYLDNASTTQKPQAVINKIREFYEEYNANIHRGLYKISEEATKQYDEAHKTVGKFINAEEKETIFTKGTTESLNMLSKCLPKLTKTRDEIVLTEMEHHANLVPWQQSGFKLKFIPIKEDYTLDYEAAQKMITEKTAIVSMNHVSNTLGTINDMKKLCEIGKSKGAITIIDGAQSVPHMKIDVKEIGCDFLAFSGHKMLGPTGIGVLYGRKELLEKMEPYQYGGDMIKKVTFESAEWNEIPMKFEAGTPNIAGAIGLAEAIRYLERIGMENIERWEKELLKYALDALEKRKNIKIYNPGSENSAGIISFNIGNAHAHDVASLADDKGICIRAGHHCTMPLMNKLGTTGTARASFYIYNTKEDIDELIKTIDRTKEIFER